MTTSEWLMGAAAYHAGKSWFDNPYDILSDGTNWDEWADGYEAAEEGKQ